MQADPMPVDQIYSWKAVPCRAQLVGKRIDLRVLYHRDSPTVQPMVRPTGSDGLAVVFRYGAVVTFNLDPPEERDFLKSIAGSIGDPFEEPEWEEVDIIVDPGGDDRVDAEGEIRLRSITTERLLVVADVLAKSVSLAYDEARVSLVFDQIEPVAEALQRPQRWIVSTRPLLEHIGDVLMTQHRMVGRVEVMEKPELLWERPELERLHLRLREEYELAERHRALARKLDLISLTASTSLGLVEARRSLRVEWYIVILIVVEIALTLYELFVHPHP